MDMCRACLSTGINMIPMDESIIENFNNVTNLNIKLPDNMLLYTCEDCHNALNFCKQFRDKCIASDHALNNLFQNDNRTQLEINHEDDDYYVVIQKEDQDDAKNFESNDNYDTEIDENDDTFKPTETIIESSMKIITDDSNNEESQSHDLIFDILCGLCSTKFSDQGMMVDHLTIHSEDKNCQICLEPCHSKSQLLAHRMLHVPDTQKGCLFCGREFVSTASLQFHYMTVHKLENNIFDELKQFYHFNKTVKFVVDENEVASKDRKTENVKKPQQQKSSNELKVIKRRIVVDPTKITLTESELKKLLLEKPKQGFIPYYCGICPQELEDKKQLNKHIKYHKMDTQCSLCDLEFTSYPHLLAHRSAHVPENQNSCLFCSRKVLDESNLEQHYLTMHQLTEEVLPYFCTQCFRTYDTEKQLNYHMKYGHGAIKYICDYCSKGFRTKGSLLSHIMTHQDLKNYKCHLCDYRSKFSGGIKEHILRRHTKSRVYCDVCRRTFPTLEMLNRHKPCQVEAETMCPICGVSLKVSSNLTRHLRTHTDIYTYKCGLCPSQYKSKTSFDAHMDKHNGIRKYECKYCPMKFYSQPVLIKHTRIHTGERPYACKLCDKKFTGNHNLKVHMRVHGLELINKKK